MKEIILNSDNFDKEVNETDRLVLIDFFATWCGPCQMLAPIIDDVAVKYVDKVKVCKVNVDDNQELAKKYGVMSIPTLVFFKNGKTERVSVGLLSSEELSDIIDSLV